MSHSIPVPCHQVPAGPPSLSHPNRYSDIVCYLILFLQSQKKKEFLTSSSVSFRCTVAFYFHGSSLKQLAKSSKNKPFMNFKLCSVLGNLARSCEVQEQMATSHPQGPEDKMKTVLLSSPSCTQDPSLGNGGTHGGRTSPTSVNMKTPQPSSEA